eukprot:GILI01007656.1.p2 GENE.GILI01007656.1~~GILI01007656.1.p2  ORF type:complete len:205 (+),score=79.70 GILI01007656.1:391-1005(+)
MKVEVWDDSGRAVVAQQGELVCSAAFPSMPLFFWNDEGGSKYHKAYFDQFPNVWRHGDFAELTSRGGMVIYGRSDATLNPGGVRIGTAELYRYLETVEELADSVAVGQTWHDDVRVVLFVKLKPGLELTEALKKKLLHGIRTNVSPRHMPAKIIAVPDIPYTINMKKVEIAVKQVIEGQAVKNKDALSNPSCLDFFANLEELKS